jgi:hypothetical protein
MSAAPRARQLRRDKTVFNLLMNVCRLHLEEDDRLAQQPQLRETPDAGLVYIQRIADQWVGLALAYVMQKHRCQLTPALRAIGELQAELKAVIPAEEVRQMPLSQVLNLPPEVLASQRPSVAG